MKQFLLSLFFVLICSVLLGTIFVWNKFRIPFPVSRIESTNVITKEDIKNYVSEDQILFEDMIRESPDGNYFVYLTANDLSMRGSKIWLIQKNGENNRVLDFGEEYRFITNPIWSPDGKSIAFLKIYPFELWTITPEFNIFDNRLNYEALSFRKVYSQAEEKDKNRLNPSLGYGGETNLRWNTQNEIIFEDNSQIPNKFYAVNVEDKNIRELRTAFQPVNNKSILGVEDIPLHSQRDPDWSKDILGSCTNETIGSAGCAVSAVSMLFNSYGVDIDPQKLNNWLKENQNQGYFGCDIRWNIAANYSDGIKLVGAYFGETSTDRVDYELNRGNSVIVGFDKVEFTNLPHWVLIIGKDKDGEYIIRDPWSTKDNEYKKLEDFGDKFDHIVVYSYLN
jgi:hypothetical protein